MADLIGVRAKLEHARTHITTFDQIFSEFLSRDPYYFTVDFDPSTGGYRCPWHVREEVPLKLSLVNGDIWANLRATLDHLVWQLVLANGQTPTERAAFPCVRASMNWPSAAGDRLKGVASRWVDEIEKLQPYQRKERPDLHPLALLDSFNNLNKHRLMPPAVTAVVELPLTISGGEKYRLDGTTFLERPIREGTELMTIRCEPAGPIPDLQIAVHADPVFHISFLDGLNTPWEMDDVVDWVERTVDIFEPAFSS